MNDIFVKMSQKREKAEKRSADQNFSTRGKCCNCVPRILKSRIAATKVLKREQLMHQIRDQTARMVTKR
jgi:hypothetical protein